MLSQSFSTKLNDISNELSMNPRDLLLVMFLESGVNPAAKNPHGGATGLIQFMPSTLKGMGVPPQDIATFGQKPATEQLDYVKKYIQAHRGLIGGRPFTSATQYYVANFFPIALKKWNGADPIKNANVSVVDSKSQDPRERAAYKENTILDANKDGVITVGDITNVLMGLEKTPRFQQLVSQFNTVAGNGVVSERMRRRVRRPTPMVEPSSVDNLLAKFMGGLNNLLDNLTPAVAGTENTFLIKIDSCSDLSSKLEYARILSMALKEELDSKANTFTDSNDVEVQCTVRFDKDKGLKAVEEVSNAISYVFDYATRKIGGVKINTSVVHNLHPRYQKLDIKLSEINYRKFHLKFVK